MKKLLSLVFALLTAQLLVVPQTQQPTVPSAIASALTTSAASAVDTPVITRTSASGVTPMTIDVALGSHTYAGYTIERQSATTNAFDVITQDVFKQLSEADLQSPFNMDWSGAIDPTPTTPWNAIGATNYERWRVIARTPLGVEHVSSWSNLISPTDVIPDVILNSSDKVGTLVLTGGSLTADNNPGTSGPNAIRVNRSTTSSKFYFEAKVLNLGGTFYIGIINSSQSLSGYAWGSAGGASLVVANDSSGRVRYNATTLATFTPAVNDVFGFSVDPVAHKVWIARNNVQLSGVPDVSGGFAIGSMTSFFPGCNLVFAAKAAFVFKAADFVYTPPSGYNPL